MANKFGVAQQIISLCKGGGGLAVTSGTAEDYVTGAEANWSKSGGFAPERPARMRYRAELPTGLHSEGEGEE